MVPFSDNIASSFGTAVAMDDKVIRRSFDRASGKSPLHMVSAWGCEQRLVLAQIATVTTDAMNCRRDPNRNIDGGRFSDYD